MDSNAGIVADETTPTNPLTTYAKANEKAEQACFRWPTKAFASPCPSIDGLRPKPPDALRSRHQRHDPQAPGRRAGFP